MLIDVLSLFPEFFESPLNTSILKRAIQKKILEVQLTNIRDYSLDKHKKVDDRPFGGGPGMVMMAEPLAKAIDAKKSSDSKVIYLSPQGKTLNAAKCRELAKCPHLVLVCGHYEGIDERIIETRIDEEISIGDYVLTNGGLAALVLIDSVARFIEGVLGHDEAALSDSFEQKRLDHPHYTKPLVFEGLEVPEVLRSGHHKEIDEWRQERAIEKTRRVRPDLL